MDTDNIRVSGIKQGSCFCLLHNRFVITNNRGVLQSIHFLPHGSDDVVDLGPGVGLKGRHIGVESVSSGSDRE